MKAVIYARYSAGPKQTDQSIEGQVRVCRKYCEEHDMEVTEIYADKHISGKTDDRPEFKRMIADSALGKFDAVCVYKTDRFSRSKIDSVIYKKQLKDNGVKLCYAAETIPEGPEGIILESLMEGLAEYYSAELAQKIRRGMYETAMKGKVLGNNIPYGYHADAERHYEIDDEESEVVKLIYDLFLRDYTVAEIKRKLTALGYMTRAGKPFAFSTLKRILSNPAYIGVYSACGFTIENKIPVIIEKEKFIMAQKKIKDMKQTRTPAASDTYLLSGKLICGNCDRPMSGYCGTSHTGKKHYYYRCPGNYRAHECDRKPIVRDAIESEVVRMTMEYVLNSDVLQEIAHVVWQVQADAASNEEEIARVEDLLNENKAKIDRLIEAIEVGKFTKSLSAQLDELESRQMDLEAELASMKTRTLELSEDQIYFFLSQFLQQGDQEPREYHKKVIESFVSEVYIYGDTLEIFYKLSENAHFSRGEIGSSLLPSVDLTVLGRTRI